MKMFFIGLQLIVFCLIVVTASVLYGINQRLSEIVPDVRFMMQRNKAEATRIWSAEDPRTHKRLLLGEVKGEQREWISLNQLKVSRKRGKVWKKEPGRLIDATIAIEDARFYEHPGMDAKRIAGAAWANFRNRDATSQGGSTITEQLAVNVYLTRTKTLSRRLQTALLALQLERRLSKDEILELYLNEIYYGNRAYGCEAAAQIYFGRHAKDLTIAQAAFMAGLPQQPARLDPFEHFDAAKARQRIVLREMLQNGKINYTQYLQAAKDTTLEGDIKKARERLIESRREKQSPYPGSQYFVSYVKQYLQKQYDWSEEFLNKSGLNIYTTLDPKLQSIAESVMRRRLNNLGGRSLQGALVCIDPWTGHVLAMYGGRDYYNRRRNGQWNRAVQGKRQPGSTFKPYIYAAALEQGYSPDSVVIDRPLRLGRQFNYHEIKNYDFAHHGALTFREAIGMSNNVAATRVLMKVGIQNVIQKAHLMGIQSSLKPYPTLALGTSEISLLEHTSAFGVFATRGLRAEETPIERVDNYAGETLVEHSHPVRGARVLSEEAARGMWSMLRYVVTNGTGRNAQISGVEVIGKTGTTSSNKDVWFMGATKQLVCGVWLGYDTPRELYGSSGGEWSAPAWRSFMLRAIDVWATRNPMDRMVEDARATSQRRLIAAQYKKYVRATICTESGLLANAACPNTQVVEFSAAGGVPTQHCTIPAHANRSEPVRSLGEYNGVPNTQTGDLDYNDQGTSESTDEPARRDISGASPPSGAGVPVEPTNGVEGVPGSESVARRQPASTSREALARSDEPRVLNEDDPASVGGEVVATVCAETGELATRYCPVTAQRFFEASTAPRHYCTLHSGR
jgi:1A family penicillin-binding protein